MTAAKRNGPRLRIVASCEGCEHHAPARKYSWMMCKADGRDGMPLWSNQPTPSWCPRMPALPDVDRMLAVVDAARGARDAYDGGYIDDATGPLYAAVDALDKKDGT